MKINQDKIENPAALPIQSVEVVNDNNFSFKFYNYGGYIHEVNIPYLNNKNKTEDVLLGYGDLEGVLNSNGYFNAIVGRVANRIGGAQFSLDDRNYKLFSNTPPNHLHGGKTGFNKKIWKIDNIEEKENSTICVLKYLSPDMEENYPGNLDCKVIYELNNDNELSIEFHATTDQDTIVNLTNHNYWNFHGHLDHYQNNEDHVVQIYSDAICETNQESIPTGKLLNVSGTKFDLRKSYIIDREFLHSGGIDHNYALDDQSMEAPVAKIYSNKTKMGVEYFTNQQGIQFYTGNMMLEKYSGKYNKLYGIQYGMCLEPQNYPDAINQSNFPSPILRKNKNYLSKIKIKLRNDF